MKPQIQLRQSETGLVSFIVTMVLMIVITLIVIGFAQVSRREQRQALDRQLSTQAFYAAESGINAAESAIKAGYTGDKTECGPNTAPEPLSGSTEVGSSLVKYTCLLIDQSPPDLQYASVDTNKLTTAEMKFKNSDGSDASATYLKIYWEPKSGDATFAGAYPEFPINGSFSMLHVAITDLVGGLSRSSLDNNTYTTYLYPQGPGGGGVITLASGATNQGTIAEGNCIAIPPRKPQYCLIRINLPAATQLIFLRLNAIYNDAHVTVEAYDASDKVLDIKGAQVLIDSTGKANDVLRRVQVRLPVHTSEKPPFAVSSLTGICKVLQVAPAYGSLASSSLECQP